MRWVAIPGPLCLTSDGAARGSEPTCCTTTDCGARDDLVHAIDEAAQAFSRGGAEFLEYPLDSLILFLQLEKLVHML